MNRCPSCDRHFDDTIAYCPADGSQLEASGRLEGGADPYIGRVLSGRYRLEQRLGVGGMGAVYRAEHVYMEKPVAVKILKRDLANDDTAVQRFRREAKGAGRVEHENCVRVTDFAREDDGTLYLVMEYLEGRTLWEVVHGDGPMAHARLLSVAVQVARALVAAHEQGVVHRDLKPENIMIVERPEQPDVVKVLDFGLAKMLHGGDGGSITQLTRAGAVFGTPRYMSPEQAEGREADLRSDLYSFGVILYEMATGTLPFDDDSVVGLLNKQVNEAPEPPRRRRPELDIHPRVESITLRCLAKDPDDRYAGARELLREIEQTPAVGGPTLSPSIPHGEMVSASAISLRPPRRGGLIAALAVVLFGGGVWAWTLLSQRPAGVSEPGSNELGAATPAARVAAEPAPAQDTEPAAVVRAIAEATPEPATPPPRPLIAAATKAPRREVPPPKARRRPPARSAKRPVSKTPVAERIEPKAPEATKPTPPPPAAAPTPEVPPEPAPVVVAKVEPPEPVALPDPSTAARRVKPKPPATTAMVLYTRGVSALRRGELKVAERDLLEAVRLHPADHRIHLALSDLYLRKKDLPYALFAARSALEHEPESVAAMKRVGKVQWMMGDYRDSQRTFRTVLQFRPGDKTAMEYLRRKI